MHLVHVVTSVDSGKGNSPEEVIAANNEFGFEKKCQCEFVEASKYITAHLQWKRKKQICNTQNGRQLVTKASADMAPVK